jgi:hypothetical protein
VPRLARIYIAYVRTYVVGYLRSYIRVPGLSGVGGDGTFVQGLLAVTPGEVLRLVVGKALDHTGTWCSS